MQRYIRGLMLAAAVAVAGGCGDDPLAEGAGGVTKLVANPTSIFLNTGDTKLVGVEAQDDLGAARAATFEITSVTPGITVTRDETFVPVFDADGTLIAPTSPTRVRYTVVGGSTVAENSFTVTAGGQSITVDVHLTPGSFPVTYSTVTPGLGEVVTATAPSGLIFTGDTEVQFAGADNAIITGLSPDGTQITFIVIPGTTGAPTFTAVGLAYAPDITYDLDTETELAAVPPPASLTAAYSDDTPDGGAAVTVTAAGFVFLPTTAVVIAGQTSANVAVAADGSSLTFVPRPGAVGIPTFGGIEIAGVVGVPLTIPGDAAVTVGATIAAAIPGTDDPNTAPAIDLPTEAGLSAVFTDQFNVTDQFYNFNVVADAHYRVTLYWEGGGSCANDVDLLTSDGNAFTCNNPEVHDSDALTAGSLYETLAEIYLVASNPDWLQMVVTKLD